MNCAKHLYKSCCESRLYSLDNKYRLLVRPLTGAAGVKNCLNEFGKIIGESAMLTEFTDEHWHCLIKEGAVNLLSSGKEAS